MARLQPPMCAPAARLAVALAVSLGAAALNRALAAPLAQDTRMGRMVPARADAPSQASTTHARSAYVLHCAGCHGLDGSGQPAKYVPGLRRLGDFLRVPGGREFIVSVPGVMASGLDDRGVVEVANWVLATLARDTVPADHQPFSLAEVTRVRATPLVDVAARRQQLVQQARVQGIAID